MKRLSIGIPTYNRKEQLINQLQSIFKNNLDEVEEIILVDNNSKYDLNDIIQNFDQNKIRVIKHKFNIGQAVNMSIPFLHCKTKWLWHLSDDDEVLDCSINNIIEEIEKSSENTVLIKFDINRPLVTQKQFVANTLETFIDYYHNEKDIRTGDLVFISTNVYNLDNLSNYLSSAFEYSYTYISYIIPVFFALNTNKYKATFSSLPVVNYLVPEKWGWSFPTLGKGISTLSHIPLKLNSNYRKKFLNITMLITFKSIIYSYIDSKNNFRHISLHDFKIIYNNIYTHYLPVKYKLVYYIFILLMSNKYTSKILVLFSKLILNK